MVVIIDQYFFNIYVFFNNSNNFSTMSCEFAYLESRRRDAVLYAPARTEIRTAKNNSMLKFKNKQLFSYWSDRAEILITLAHCQYKRVYEKSRLRFHNWARAAILNFRFFFQTVFYYHLRFSPRRNFISTIVYVWTKLSTSFSKVEVK